MNRVLLVLAVLASLLIPAPAVAAAPAWQPRWSADPGRDGLAAFEGVEDDRANSHPGVTHIYVQQDTYRFDMHTRDRDISTDRQRQEVRGMRELLLLKGETWRFSQQMYIPGSLKATTTFTHIMQMKMPGTGSLPILTVSLQRVNNVPKIQLKNGSVLVGSTDLAPLQNKWIDLELEMTIGDAPDGRLRWVLRDGTRTVLDVTKSGLDTWLGDRVRPKWGIYRSLGDKSGSLQDTYLLLRNMHAEQWSTNPTPPVATRYEAEGAAITRGVVEREHADYSGTGYVNTDNAIGSALEWTVTAPRAGDAALNLRYSNGTTAQRPMDLAVNGTVLAAGWPLPNTLSWDEWDTRTLVVPLLAGANRIRLTATTADGGPNLDYLLVTVESAAAAKQGGRLDPGGSA